MFFLFRFCFIFLSVVFHLIVTVYVFKAYAIQSIIPLSSKSNKQTVTAAVAEARIDDEILIDLQIFSEIIEIQSIRLKARKNQKKFFI